jgi:hypothetical protein
MASVFFLGSESVDLSSYMPPELMDWPELKPSTRIIDALPEMCPPCPGVEPIPGFEVDSCKQPPPESQPVPQQPQQPQQPPPPQPVPQPVPQQPQQPQQPPPSQPQPQPQPKRPYVPVPKRAKKVKKKGFLIVPSTVRLQKAQLKSIGLPSFVPSITDGSVPYVSNKLYVRKAEDEGRCMIEAFCTATGHSLDELRLGKVEHDEDGMSVAMLTRALHRCDSMAHLFSLAQVKVPTLRWLPLFTPQPQTLLTGHAVIPDNRGNSPGAYHWCVLDLARLVFFVGPSSRAQDEDVVQGAVIIELQDLQQGEQHIASFMAAKYSLGPPMCAYRLNVNARGAARTNFHQKLTVSGYKRRRPSAAVRAKRACVNLPSLKI